MAAEQVVDGVDVAGLGAHVDGGGVAVEAEVVLGGREADEDRGVDVGGEHGGVQDAGYVEPHVVEPDPLAGEDPVDPEALGGGRAEHGDGFLGGRRVEVAALGHAGAHGAQQAEAGRVDGEGVGVDGGDERAAVDVAADRCRSLGPG